MALQRSSNDGRLYGSAPVILSREVDGKIEYIIGYAAPFSGVRAENFEGSYFVEEPYSWWEAKGFRITESPELAEARALASEFRKKDRAKS